uniref:Ribosomal protein L23 n=1 Tax=Nitzschia putrida TaxID=2742595 RepID=A0A7R7TR25_9STRA|nr:ribosomal protein L23 [Nitzschia putrida]
MQHLVEYPLITAKIRGFMKQSSNRRNYSFLVNIKLTKKEMKQFIEDFFNVNVYKITLTSIPKKKICTFKYPGFKPKYKKATIYIEKKKIKQNTNYIPYSIFNQSI